MTSASARRWTWSTSYKSAMAGSYGCRADPPSIQRSLAIGQWSGGLLRSVDRIDVSRPGRDHLINGRPRSVLTLFAAFLITSEPRWILVVNDLTSALVLALV